MKKQIAVLMAAATAVTTVAPAIAHADVNNHKDVVANIVAEAKKALETKYANKDANGITIPDSSNPITKSYLNSRYIVLVENPGVSYDKENKKNEKLQGFYSLSNPKAGYAQFGDKLQIQVKESDASLAEEYITPNSERANQLYVVDDITNLENLLESNDDAKVYIVDKGGDDKNNSYVETSDKHYVLAGGNVNADTEETLNQAYIDIRNVVNASLTDNKQSYIKSVTVYTQDTTKPGVIKVTEKKVISEEKNSNKITVPKLDDSTIVDNGKIKSGVVIRKIEVELQNGNVTKTLEVNSPVYDFTKTFEGKKAIELFDRNGNGFKIKGENTIDVLKKIDTIGTVENDGDSAGQKIKVMAYAPGSGNVDEYAIVDQTPEKIELKNIYTRENGYTQEGADFVNSIIKARKGKSDFSFNFRGVNYILDGDIDFSQAKVDVSGNGYKLSLPVKVKNANDLAMSYTLRFEIYGDSQKDLYDVLRDLQGTVDVVPGHFTKLAGTNRYATAIAVSQEQFKPETADSVVIVGGYAQMDGLAAAPLASAKNAPILLADPKTGISEDTMKEIKRACKSLRNRTVYIVGGPHSVPMSVESQLEKEFGAVVVRSYGVDRNATSLAVAKRLFWDGQTNDKVFIVGRDGGADAMGVASVASKFTLKTAEEQRRAQGAAQTFDDMYNRDSKTTLGDLFVTPAVKKVVDDLSLAKAEYIKAEKDLETKDEAYRKAVIENIVRINLTAYINEKNVLDSLNEIKKKDNTTKIDDTLIKQAKAAYKEDKENINGLGYQKILASDNIETIKALFANFEGYKTLTGDEQAALQKQYVKDVVEGFKKEIDQEAARAYESATGEYKEKFNNGLNGHKLNEVVIADLGNKADETAPEQAKKAAENALNTAKENLNKAEKAYKNASVLTEINNNAIKYSILNGRSVSPIIVVNKNSMDRSTRDFIGYGLSTVGISNIYMIGGENSLSTNIRRELKVAAPTTGPKITRLSGQNRYETNVAVINNFYTKGNVGGAVFTSGEDKYLVDSQTAGFFAASKNAPIVLTGNALTSSQVDLMKKNGVLDGQRAGIYQVGGVVSADVMKNVVQLLGL